MCDCSAVKTACSSSMPIADMKGIWTCLMMLGRRQTSERCASGDHARAFPTLSEPVELPQRRACSLMWFRLGRVDGFDDDEAEGESDERAEVRVGFLATEGDALEA